MAVWGWEQSFFNHLSTKKIPEQEECATHTWWSHELMYVLYQQVLWALVLDRVWGCRLSTRTLLAAERWAHQGWTHRPFSRVRWRPVSGGGSGVTESAAPCCISSWWVDVTASFIHLTSSRPFYGLFYYVTPWKTTLNQRKYRSVFHSCLLMLTAPFLSFVFDLTEKVSHFMGFAFYLLFFPQNLI